MCIDEFIKAAKSNNTEVIKAYIQNGFNINTKDKDGFTAVMEAAEFGHKDLFWFLAKNGANLLLKTDYNFAIIHAIGLGGDKKMLDFALQQGADISDAVIGGDQNGMTIKDYALLSNNTDILSFI